jgi:hypothetical protein
MTTLYLDFDGVLHLDHVHNVDGRPELGVPGLLFQHAPILEEALGYHPEVKIVLSTSWVGTFGFEATLAYFPPRIRERVTGATWREPQQVGMYSMDRFSDLTRFQQIMSHVTANRITNWLALDDLHSNSQGWPDGYRKHLILCHPDKGLGDPEVQAALNTALAERQYDQR